MDDVLPRLELAIVLPPDLDQPRQLARLDALLERRIEGAAERDVDGAAMDLDPLRPHEGRYVAKAHGRDAVAFHVRPRLEAARGNVDHDVVLALPSLDDTRVAGPRDERDRPVAARGRVARVVEEDDAEVGAVVVRLDDVALVHVGMAARLVHEQPADVVEPLERVATLVEDRPTA